MHNLKRNSILLLLFSLLCNTAFSQQVVVEPVVVKNSKTSLKLYAGYVIPTGEFAELSDNDFDTYNITSTFTDFNIAGKATGGFCSGLAISYQFYKFFEMGLQTDYSIIKTEPSNFRDLFDLDSLTEISASSTSGNWETITSLLTASGNVYYKKWKGTLSVMAGIQFAWSPEATLTRNVPETGTFNGVDAFHTTYIQPTRHNSAPCYGAAAHISYELNKKFSVVLSGNFQTSKHEFNEGAYFDTKTSIMTPQGVVNTVITTRDFNFSKTISYYTAGLGVSYAFRAR